MGHPTTSNDSTRVCRKGFACEHERKAAEYGLTLATLCDLVLGEDANNRSDEALVLAVSRMVRGNLNEPITSPCIAEQR